MSQGPFLAFWIVTTVLIALPTLVVTIGIDYFVPYGAIMLFSAFLGLMLAVFTWLEERCKARRKGTK